MSEPSEIPRSLPNLHFPYGDIDESEHTDKAHAWLEGCENLEGNQEQKIRRVFHEINTTTLFWDATPTSRKIHKEAIDLCNAWDEQEHPGQQFARIGFVAAHSLVIRSRIFPPALADFSTELENMKDPEKTNVRRFGETARKGTEASYPTLFEINERLNNTLSDLRGGLSEEDLELQQAGIGLSTTLGVYSRIAGYISQQRYRGVKVGIDTDVEKLENKPINYWLER